MSRSVLQLLWIAVGAVALSATGAQAGTAAAGSSAVVAQKTIPLRPSITFVKASFLTGELTGLRIVEQVDTGTGQVVGSPMLHATLQVSNDSRDRAAHLLGGKIEYIDSAGHRIPMTDTGFLFESAAADRLDPGKSVSQAIDIPFPRTALQRDALREVSLELTYLPMAYQTDAVNIPVYLGG